MGSSQSGLLDYAWLFDVREVSGKCWCCNGVVIVGFLGKIA